jgi:hypothetical protein
MADTGDDVRLQRSTRWRAGLRAVAVATALLAGADVDQEFITTAQPEGPDAVVAGSGHLYWTNEDGNEIGRADLNGTGVNQSSSPALISPTR